MCGVWQKDEVVEVVKQFIYHQTSCVLMIEAKPGLGKSSLLDEIAAYVHLSKDTAPSQVTLMNGCAAVATTRLQQCNPCNSATNATRLHWVMRPSIG